MIMRRTEMPTPGGMPGRDDEGPHPGLSDHDLHHLGELETKFQLVRDFTNQVVNGYTTGLCLYGAGGCGKSYTVIRELDRQRANYKLFNSRMTGRGLYNALERFPDSVHLLEDMEQIAHDPGARGVLRSALWGQRSEGQRGPLERTVTWSTCRKEHTFIFTGGIIMTANKPMGDLPELQALKTRIACYHLRATDAELAALMRSVALAGFEHDDRSILPAECLEVCEFIIGQSRSLHRSLDMRLFANSLMDYLSWQECDAGCHWRDLAATRLRERATHFDSTPNLGSRADRKRCDQDIARTIALETPDRRERFRLWFQQTGKSEPTLYRRLAKIGQT
jgi:hypothetical protein